MLKLPSMNFAVAVTLAAGVRLQALAVPLHAPLQLTKTSPGAAMAVSVSCLLMANCAEALVQPLLQLIAAGLLTIEPWPVPVASFCAVTVTTLPMSLVTAARLLVVSGSVVPGSAGGVAGCPGGAVATLTTLVTWCRCR